MNAKDIFGSFFLGESEFALSIAKVQEVVNPPNNYTIVPLAPKFLKGMFNLRGTIVPVVDLRDILNLNTVEVPEQKIAVLEHEGVCLGLLFDRTGEIFKNVPEERSDFSADSGAVICGAFKKDEGKRLIQILDVGALLTLPKVPRPSASERTFDTIRKKGSRKQCVSFTVGSARCALEIGTIQEILKVGKIDASSLAIHQCIGMIDLRGNTVPIIDFAALLGYRLPESLDLVGDAGNRRIMVMKLGEEYFGLMVDAVENLVTYYAEDLAPFPVLGAERPEMFLGCVTRPEENDILLLNTARILSSEEIAAITHGHCSLYQSTTGTRSAGEKGGQTRKTYITFVVEDTLAVGIEEVREIIEYPETMLHPPGLPAHFKGVLNLRGEMIIIVDARQMYGKAQSTDGVPGKVLIFKRDGVHFGLVVDSVESIVSFSEADKMKLPSLLYQNSSGHFHEDMLEAVEIPWTDDRRLGVLILNPQAIAARVTRASAA
jgi:purine-binding chemotaxis protein CheW